jgi:hypothetical protein
MSAAKEKIPIEKLADAVAVSLVIHDAMLKSLADYRAADASELHVEGWKTLVRAYRYSSRIARKLVGPADPVHRLDVERLLMPQHRKPTKKKIASELDEAATATRRKRKP